jgi:hypothetical protein
MRSVNEIDVNAVNRRTRQAGCTCDRCTKTIKKIIEKGKHEPTKSNKKNL